MDLIVSVVIVTELCLSLQSMFSDHISSWCFWLCKCVVQLFECSSFVDKLPTLCGRCSLLLHCRLSVIWLWNKSVTNILSLVKNFTLQSLCYTLKSIQYLHRTWPSKHCLFSYRAANKMKNGFPDARYDTSTVKHGTILSFINSSILSLFLSYIRVIVFLMFNISFSTWWAYDMKTFWFLQCMQCFVKFNSMSSVRWKYLRQLNHIGISLCIPNNEQPFRSFIFYLVCLLVSSGSVCFIT